MAEWALAVWCVASGDVVTELLPMLEAVLEEVPARRRRTILQAAQRVAKHGWLKQRPVRGTTNDSDLARLIRLRDSASPSRQGAASLHPGNAPDRVPSLLKIARERAWLKVDSKASYR